MKKSDLYISLLMACTGIAALVKASGYPEQSRMMPFIYSSALILFSLLFGLRTFFAHTKSDGDSVEKEEPIKKVFFVMAIILGYITSIQILGFYTSTTLFLLVFMGLMHAASWYISIGVSVATSVVVYFFFETLLNIPVPEGIFF